MAKFATHASGAIWWPILQLMQVALSGEDVEVVEVVEVVVVVEIIEVVEVDAVVQVVEVNKVVDLLPTHQSCYMSQG